MERMELRMLQQLARMKGESGERGGGGRKSEGVGLLTAARELSG